MKNKLSKLLITLAVATSLVTAASITQAYSVGYSGSKYVCRWMPGHWKHGHWIEGNKVCWWKKSYNRHCFWVPGHWYHGYWVPPHKSCRY